MTYKIETSCESGDYDIEVEYLGKEERNKEIILMVSNKTYDKVQNPILSIKEAKELCKALHLAIKDSVDNESKVD